MSSGVNHNIDGANHIKLICPMYWGLMLQQVTLLLISFSTELAGAACTNK